MITANSFFAGIGGFDRGFERAGIRLGLQCEVDKFCRNILNDRWPDVVCFGDINSLQPGDINEADIWCGGFPCQDVSIARGSKGRKGLAGKESGLFFRFAELAERKLPQVIILENVVGLLNSHDGRDFLTVLQRLTNLGYGIAWRVLNARFFGVPQSRPRIVLCAWLHRPDLASGVLYELEGAPKPTGDRSEFMTSSEVRSGTIVPRLAYCLAATSGRHTGTDWSRSYVTQNDRVRRLTPTECERLQGFPDNWTLPSSNEHLSSDSIDSMRYKSLGNAVAVPVAEWVGKRVVERIFKPTLPIHPGYDFPEQLAEDLRQTFPEFQNNSNRFMDLDIAETMAIRCQSGGVAFGNFYFDARVSASPSRPVKSEFINVVETSNVESKYYLSCNAAQGILRRVRSQRRKLFPPLENALNLMSQSETTDLPIRSLGTN